MRAIQERSYETAARLLAAQFLGSGKAQRLLWQGADGDNGKLQTTRLHRLESILTSAAQLARDLSTQRSLVRVLGLDELGVDTCFTVDSSVMEAHALHRLEVDDDSESRTRLNGAPVRVVVRPAVIAEVFDETSGRVMQKTWSKACVWVDEGNEKESG